MLDRSKIKIAIHHRAGSFSDKWIRWCIDNHISFKIVNAYDSNIINELKDCTGFMWHWHHEKYADQLFARQLILSLETCGKKVFPNVATSWHFDDKLGQKYLFEALSIPTPKSMIFYDKTAALNWINSAQLPLVFKLRGGAGSNNVSLVSSYAMAVTLIKKAFTKGFLAVNLKNVAYQSIWEYRRNKSLRNLIRSIYHWLRWAFNITTTKLDMMPRQLGYIILQEFIPNNKYDDRLVVIGSRCFCVRRICRSNDFRASGSGEKLYDHNIFPIKSIELAYKVAKTLKLQSVAMDIVYDDQGNPLVVEISYGFVTGSSYEDCDGYYDNNHNWIDVKVRPEVFMMEDFIAGFE